MALRKLPARVLVAVGAALFLFPIANDFWMQSIANNTNAPLTGIWTEPGAEIEEFIGLGLVFNYFLRALGMILMGAGLYRLGFMNGEMSAGTYRTVAATGIGIGLPLAALGVVLVAANDFSKEVAFIGSAPNNLGRFPPRWGT